MGFKKGIRREELSIGLLEELLGPGHPVRLLDLLVEKIVPQLEGCLEDVGHNKVGPAHTNARAC